ncbi:hypothetical protein GCK72_001189 [Caenorhabditis remanei]|uniref:CID domain-containing protein n=1 Tax=Caenorhabditis remanei TaxID=31234 RepID=A0A6A5HUA7_CAERE|nr:hypothetical protein GCK72_001189 [Caenorhabditis remanei]KAF1769372.1 hypothetical protein GCK72_001189 [Caenorhabditis remanei]
MDSDLLKKFNAELATLHDSRNLSKNKIQEITNAAIKAQKQYKHCKPEQRLHVLYVIDNVVRSSKHQLKERDTFGPRFLKQWDKFMEPLLKCSWREKLKIVRTLNLWLCNRIFTETQMQPIREKWQKAGLPIDFEGVEKAVKGDKADMNIYSASYKKKSRTSGGHHRSRTPPNPPLDEGLLGAGHSTSFKSGPDIPNFVLSEELVNGTISEREMLEMIQKFDIDRAGVLTKDRTLLQEVLQTFVGSLSQKITEVQSERNKENGSSIENVLTKDFEYSDDEEEKEKYAEKEEQKNMNHDEILGLAQTMLTQSAVISKITEVLEEFRSDVIQERYNFIELLREAEEFSERNPFDVIDFSKKIWDAASICLAVYLLEHLKIRVRNNRAMSYIVDIICLFFTDAKDCVDLMNLWADAEMCHKNFYHHSLRSTSKRRTLISLMRELPQILEKSDLSGIEGRLGSHEKLKLINIERDTWLLGGKQYDYCRNAY